MSDTDASVEGEVQSGAKKTRRPRGRSPAYPAIDLEKAVLRVGQLYRKDKQYPISVNTVPAIWNYNSLNGPAALSISALKKFGLIEDSGSKSDREITVSDLAVQILNHPSTDAKAEAIKQAALNPPIHREMWDEYGVDLPSDANLEWRLTRDRGFTETGAREFIKEYRETITFAELGEDDAFKADLGLADSDAPEFDADAEPSRFQQSAASGRQYVEQLTGEGTLSASMPLMQNASVLQQYPIPIARQGRPPVTISGAFPLSSDEWDRFKAVLEAMKPVLVDDEGTAANP
jgi:hypothetical protein